MSWLCSAWQSKQIVAVSYEPINFSLYHIKSSFHVFFCLFCTVVWCTPEKEEPERSGYSSSKGEERDIKPVIPDLSYYMTLLSQLSLTDRCFVQSQAKLSCLVVKCQERNILLVQMMKAMRGRGCVDSALTQQVERLLSDAALQDYTAAFTPGGNVKSREYTAGFISKFQDYTSGFTPDQTAVDGFTPESGGKCRELRREKHTTMVATESATICRSEVAPAPTGTLKNSSPVPTSPVPEHVRVPATPSPTLRESFITNTAQVRSFVFKYSFFLIFLRLNGCRRTV